MLKKMTIRNFKAIQDMTIEFTPLTVLIGANACGKTSILQALDFLRSAASRDIYEYLKDRAWSFEELKSKLPGGMDKPVEFIVTYNLNINDTFQEFEWTFSVDKHKATWIVREQIINTGDGTVLLSCGFKDRQAVPVSFEKFYFQSSALKYIKEQLSDEYKELSVLKQFLMCSNYYGLLSPEKMRENKTAIPVENIGVFGETLKAFVHHLPEQDKTELNKTVSDFLDSAIEIKTYNAGSSILLVVEETFGSETTQVDAWHASDGLLRIIAFVSIKLEKPFDLMADEDDSPMVYGNGDYMACEEAKDEVQNGMILLDEIEDGINPYLTEKVVGFLQSMVKDTNRQIIVTTHSPIVADDVIPEDIVFLWKDDNGSVHGRPLFSIGIAKEMLDFLNPGEAWMNIRQEDLLAKAGA
jgi:predicted ATPase